MRLMPCLTNAYTRKPFSSGFMITVASSLSHPPLPLASVITLSCRGDNVVQTSVPLSDVRVLCAAAETRAPAAGPHSLPRRPRFLSFFVCVLLPPFLFLLSFASGSRFDPENGAKYARKTCENIKKKKKKKKSVNYINYYSQDKLVKTSARRT
jgi:hypothetical protein